MASESSCISRESLNCEDSLDSERGNTITNCRVDCNREALLHETMPPVSKATTARGYDYSIHPGPERRARSSGNAPAQRAKPAIKDKRKLREKRRSTGMVQVMSTESTGDSLDEDETRRNTTFNETSFAEEDSVTQRQYNKSPSDLEADFEDNQDYDSTVSQSESNPVSIGVSGNSSFFDQDGQSSLAAGCSAAAVAKTDKSNAGISFDGLQCTESDEFSQPDDTSSTDHKRDPEDNDRNSLEKLLEQEKQEMQRLKKLLELREQRIGEIEKKLSALT